MAEFENAGIQWVKSTRSAGGNCVEIAILADQDEVLVRDSKNRDGSILHVPSEAWRRFVHALRAGEFDL